MRGASQMQWPKRSFAAAILMLTLYTAYTAGHMRVYSDIGPGPGLFPLVLSILLAILTVIWLLARTDKAEMPERIGWQGCRKTASIVIAIVLSILAMPYLGFTITCCMVMSFITYETG